MNKGNITDAQYNTIKNILKTSPEVRGTQRKIVFEFNHNRYTRNIKVSSSSTQYDDVNYPLESIVEPRRPTKSGIVKGYLGIPFKTTGYIGKIYPVDETDYYKYWKSNEVSAPTLSNGAAAIPEVIVAVDYGDRGVPTNKIKLLLEATYVNIKTYRIQIKITEAGVDRWVTIGDQTNAPVNGVGAINLHMPTGWENNKTQPWQARENRDTQVTVKGVRLFVSALNVASSRLMVIELGARLVKDLSNRLIEGSLSIDEELAETDKVVPLGAATTNVASASFENYLTPQAGTPVYDRLDKSEPDSLYYNILDKNAEARIYFSIANIDVLMATMHVQSWNNQIEGEVQVDMEDSSSFLKNIQVPRMYMENKRVGEIIIHILNRLGFTNYNFKEAEDDVSQKIPYFWTDGEANAWSIISDLAKSTQTGVWINELDEINVYHRQEVYRKKDVPDWTFTAENKDGQLSDIFEYSETDEVQANVAKATWRNTSVSELNGGYPKMETVWEQTDTLVLRSSPLNRELLRTDSVILTNKADATTWPYAGVMNINGEYIRYEGKEYAYYDTSSRRVLKRIQSQEEKEALDNKSSDIHKWRNEFTGKLYAKDDEIRPNGSPVGRGIFKSPIMLTNSAHNLDALRNTTGQLVNIDGIAYDKVVARGNYANLFPAPKGGFFSAKNSALRIVTDKTWTTSHQMLLRSRLPMQDPIFSIGTRLRMNKTTPNKFNEAGLFFKQGATSNDNAGAWFVSLVPTNSVLTGFGRSRKEVNIWKRDAQGNRTLLASENLGIFQDAWYDLDVRVITESDGIIITVFVNGRPTLKYRGNRDHNRGQFCGLFAGGFTEAEYEYYYLKNESRSLEFDSPDQSDFYDKLKGDFSSGIIDKNFLGGRGWKMRKSRPEYFTDFGSNIHEVREMDVKFEKAPVQHSKIFISHEKVACTEYNSDAFGAQFLIANASRENAIANGEDKVTFGADNPVTQKMLIYGRLINQDDGEVEEVRSEHDIRVRSEIETSFESDYIQTKSFAQSLTRWVKRVWGTATVNATMNVFGNPLIKIGDVVKIDYPQKAIPASRQYLVTAVRSGFETGLTTELELRGIN